MKSETTRFSRCTFRGAALAVLAAAALAMPASLEAQDDRGFLFDRPSMHLDVFGGFAVPEERGEIFDFTRDLLTVEEGDFRSHLLGGALGFRVSERFDVAAEVAFARAEARSEDRFYVEEDGSPVEQGTRLTRVPVTLLLRGYLTDRGRSVGRFAWVPTSWAPYLGAGGGWIWHEFVQAGDFVDEGEPASGDEVIFNDRFRSAGFAPALHLLAGSEISLSPRLLMMVEGRYSWADDPLDPSAFENFTEGIDLSGFQGTLGLSVRLTP